MCTAPWMGEQGWEGLSWMVDTVYLLPVPCNPEASPTCNMLLLVAFTFATRDATVSANGAQWGTRWPNQFVHDVVAIVVDGHFVLSDRHSMSTLGMDDRIAGVLCELWATGVRVVLEAKRLQASTEVGAYHTQDASKSNHPKGILSLVPCVYVCVCVFQLLIHWTRKKRQRIRVLFR